MAHNPFKDMAEAMNMFESMPGKHQHSHTIPVQWRTLSDNGKDMHRFYDVTKLRCLCGDVKTL